MTNEIPQYSIPQDHAIDRAMLDVVKVYPYGRDIVRIAEELKRRREQILGIFAQADKGRNRGLGEVAAFAAIIAVGVVDQQLTGSGDDTVTVSGDDLEEAINGILSVSIPSPHDTRMIRIIAAGGFMFDPEGMAQAAIVSSTLSETEVQA